MPGYSASLLHISMTFSDTVKYETLTATVKNWAGRANDEKSEGQLLSESF